MLSHQHMVYEHPTCAVLQNATYSEDFDSFSEMNAMISGGSVDGIMEDYKLRLIITEQPADTFRYRYKSEKGSHGGIKGETARSKKSYPTVKVEKCLSNLRKKIIVKVSLYANEDDPKPHVYDLIGKNSDGAKVDENFMAIFQSLAISTRKKEEVLEILKERKKLHYDFHKVSYDDASLEADAIEEMKSFNLDSAKLCFQAFSTDDINTPLSEKVFSNPINNQKSAATGDLKITRLSHCSGKGSGGDLVILLCEKVKKDDIKIRFFEDDGDWEDEAEIVEIHHQVAITVTTPAYYQTNVSKKVFIELYRPSDKKASDRRQFTYIPVDDGILHLFNKKLPNSGTANLIKNEFETPRKRKRQEEESTKFPECHSSTKENLHSSATSTSDLLHPSFSSDFNLLEFLEDCGDLELFSDVNGVSPVGNQTSSMDGLSEESFSPSQMVGSDGWSDQSEDFLGKSEDPFPMPMIQESELFSQCYPIKVDGISEISNSMGALLLAEQSKQGLKISKIPKASISLVIGLKRILQKDERTYLHYAPHLIPLQDEAGNNLLHLAVMGQSSDMNLISKMLEMVSEDVINHQNRSMETPLHLAVKGNHVKILVLLLARGGDPNLSDRNGNNCVHLAAKFGLINCLKVLMPPSESRTWKHKITEIDRLNYDGMSALHLAVTKNFEGCVNFLLNSEADVNLSEKKCGLTSLHLAVVQQPSLLQVILKQPNIDVNAEDFKGYTAVQLACLKTGKQFEVVSEELKDNKNAIIKFLENFNQNEEGKDSRFCEEESDTESTDSSEFEDAIEDLNSISSSGLICKEVSTTELFCTNETKSSLMKIEEELHMYLDKDDKWKKLANLIGLSTKHVALLDEGLSPGQTVLRKIKDLYHPCQLQTIIDMLKLAELEEGAQILQKNS